ncbi:hypothetical protein [Methanobrevibacter sp. DSM 116169]|uniref:hypothetical protein n=1 Tax=Methanobrevibacter sp. DSM 116169 TaxID=3242727 RepID=UPI0038FD316B
MTYFLDTNVIVGFVINQDPWHNCAMNVFKKKCDKYISNTVENEFIDLLNIIPMAYNHFFTELENSLNNKYFIEENEFIKISKNVSNMQFYNKTVDLDKEKIGKIIWDKFGAYGEVSVKNLINHINEICNEFNKVLANNYSIFDNQIKNHIRKNEYLNIHKQLKHLAIIENGKKIVIHFPDDEIILDVHDLSNQNIVDFITGDLKLFKFKNDILNITNIPNILPLTDFTF